MSLTTEQKINLLILAGYEPGVHGQENGNAYIRVHSATTMLWMNQIEPRTQWEVCEYGSQFLGVYASTWDTMNLETCPDELIYQATSG